MLSLELSIQGHHASELVENDSSCIYYSNVDTTWDESNKETEDEGKL